MGSHDSFQCRGFMTVKLSQPLKKDAHLPGVITGSGHVSGSQLISLAFLTAAVFLADESHELSTDILPDG